MLNRVPAKQEVSGHGGNYLDFIAIQHWFNVTAVTVNPC